MIFGKGPKNPSYQPQDEFKLHNYVNLGIFSINQAVIYLFLAGILTCVTMIYVARRMQQRPNRVQTLVELIFQGLQNNIVGANMDRKMAARWFPFVATLALFIFFSNLVGFIPLPTNTVPSTSTSSAGTSRRSRSTRRPRTSRSRSCSRWSCSSPTPSRASARRGRSATSRA